MDVSLTPKLERRIAEKLCSGQYSNASEVVQDGLRMLFKAEERLTQLRAEIQLGLDQLDHGESVSAETVFEDIDRLLESRRRA